MKEKQRNVLSVLTDNARKPQALRTASVRLMAVSFAAAGLVAIAGCGGSSKPAYCSDRSNLQSSIKGLTDLNASSGISGLKTQLATIQRDATKVVDSAKSDFPSQTSAIKSSVASLQQAVNALPANPSSSQLVPVATAAAGVVTSVKSFTDATSSNCN
jgi:hypothetical protein